MKKFGKRDIDASDIIDSEYTINRFENLIEEGHFFDILVGTDEKYRFVDVIGYGSYFRRFSDAKYLLHHYIFPMYLLGQKEIKEMTEENIIMLSKSNVPICFFQSISFVFEFLSLEEDYILPFTIDVYKIAEIINSRADEVKKLAEKADNSEFFPFANEHSARDGYFYWLEHFLNLMNERINNKLGHE
ncbi:MAG: hypothetical protein HDT25_04265 [Ruminococcus sp.]|nr:hypothetical protein [Ruminococcus sp.]